MKRQFIFLFLPLFFLGSLSLAFAAASFKDVPESSKYYKAVEYFKKTDSIKGYSDGNFKPDQRVNRAEALKMIFDTSTRDFTITEVVVDKDLFSDVKKGDWFAPYVKKALSLGIVSGNSDGTFAPARTVNKAELIKMIILANQVDTSGYTRGTTPVAKDVPLGVWFYNYMAYAKEFGLIFLEKGELKPAQELSRGEAMLIMYNFIKNIKGGKIQELLSRTDAKLSSLMEKVANKEFTQAQTVAKDAVNLAMEAYALSPTELIVIDAAKTAKAFSYLVDGYIAIANQDNATGKKHIEAALAKAKEITHPSIQNYKTTITSLAERQLYELSLQ